MIALYGLVYEISNIGHLSRAFFPTKFEKTLSSNEHDYAPNVVKRLFENKGFLSLDEEADLVSRTHDRHQKFLKNDLSKFSNLLKKQQSEYRKNFDPQYNQTSTWRAQLMQSLLNKKFDTRYTSLFLPPLPDSLYIHQALALNFKGHVLNYNRPDQYPEFWHPTAWFDDSHLNNQAALKLTKHMADDFCPLIK